MTIGLCWTTYFAIQYTKTYISSFVRRKLAKSSHNILLNIINA